MMTYGSNLLLNNITYLHPLTRISGRHERLTLTAEGDVIELPGTQPVKRTVLTDIDVANYYYELLGKEPGGPFLKRDAGVVRYMVKNFGLDHTLFAIDALFANYSEDEHRSQIPPDLIAATNFIEIGQYRASEVRIIAEQYGIR